MSDNKLLKEPAYTKEPVYANYDGVQREIQGISLTKDKNGHYWLWSDDLACNLSYKQPSKEIALGSAIKSLLFTIEQLKKTEKAYFAMQQRLHKFMEGEGWEEIDPDKNAFYESYR